MTSDPDGDQRLVRLAQQGESEAFSLLVAKYRGRIVRLVSRVTTNPSDVDDVVQETFIKAFRALPNFRGDATFSTWLYRIAVNVAKTHWRDGNRDASMITSDEQYPDYGSVGDSLVDDETPESILENKQLATAMLLGIETLPFELRTALTLREIDGLSYDKISEIMDCPVGTVRSRIFRVNVHVTQ